MAIKIPSHERHTVLAIQHQTVSYPKQKHLQAKRREIKYCAFSSCGFAKLFLEQHHVAKEAVFQESRELGSSYCQRGREASTADEKSVQVLAMPATLFTTLGKKSTI